MSAEPSAAAALPAGLYLVATPIGNLRDITQRALDVLAAADLVACEDTRMTGKLFEAYGLRQKMISYNDHNAARQRGPVIEAIVAGRAVALVSDAGMPLISDPGYKLVRDCLDLGLTVTSVPGASATLAALQLSGLPSDRFSFIGFLPPKSAARRTVLREWAGVRTTLVMFETGPRLLAALEDIEAVLGARPLAVVREITKKFEEIRRGSAAELLSRYDGQPPKGEIVLVAGPPEDGEGAVDEADLDRRILSALETMRVKDAASFVAAATGQKRRLVYERALFLTRGSGGGEEGGSGEDGSGEGGDGDDASS